MWIDQDNYKKYSQGFTLMELVVSIAVFSILIMVIIGVYVAFSNNQLRAQSGQKVLNDGQYALEVMAREIRNNAVYYPASPACPQDQFSNDFDYCLRLQRQDGAIFAFAGHDDSTEIYYAVYDGATWELTELINMHKIVEIDFIVEPSSNPYLDGGPNQQPKVTIRSIVQPDTQRDIERSTFHLQTTISSRVYKR